MPIKYLKYLDQQLFNQLKKASINPHPKVFLKAFAQFFLVVLIAFLGVTFAIAATFWFIVDPLWNKLGGNNLVYISSVNNGQQDLSKQDLDWVKKRLTAFEKMVTDIIDNKFWENNQKQYTYELTNYKGVLDFVRAETVYQNKVDKIDPVEISRKYIYNFTVCPMAEETEEDCFKIVGNNKETTKYASSPGLPFIFDTDEIIDSLAIDAYKMAGLGKYIFIGKVTTNKNTYPLMIYPANRNGDLYYAALDAQNNLNSEISFVEDLESGLRFKLETPQYRKMQTNSSKDLSAPVIELYLQGTGNLEYVTNVAPSESF